jgi:hypothetical protein
MTDSKAIERHLNKMAVLGGRFQLGDLYDYRNDTILSGTKNNYYIQTPNMKLTIVCYYY